jgi:short-subunit dehydrogenase
MSADNSHILLTGASSGIGLETARLLTACGLSVWGTSRDLKRLPTLPNFHPVVMDLTDPKSIQHGFAFALREAGYFDVLINNAGAGHFGPVELQPAGLLLEQFQLMVHGPLQLIRLALPQMRERQHGRIINVTSLAARFPIPYLGPYSATKAALASLSANLRLELAHTPIRITDLQPGDIATNFHIATQRQDQSEIRNPKSEIETAWTTIERNMAAAPSPALVAQAILRLIRHPNPPPVVAVGNLFQTRLAPLLARLAPPCLVEWAIRRYYGL